MNVKSAEKKEKSTVELVVEISAEEFDAAVEKVYRKNKNSISVPGFRKGKAPRKIIEGMYGASVFYEEAVEAVYPDAYAEAVKAQELDVVGYPSIEIESVGAEGVTFKAVVPVRPEVKLGEYKGLTAPKAEVEITETDVERELNPLIERASRMVSVERESKLGDTVVIDFDGFLNGERFDGGKGEGYNLELGSHTFVPGFEDGVVGMKAGDEKDIELTFPKEYPENLANKDVVFKVKVQEVKEKVAPVVDDEFAKDVSEFETLEELKNSLTEKLREHRQANADRDYENALMEQVCNNMEVEIPDGMVDYRVDEMLQDFAQRISGQGIPFEEYMKYMDTDANAMRTQMRPNAIATIKTTLALEAIVAAENIVATDEEAEEEIKNYAEQANLEIDKVKEMANMDELKKDLALRKASKLVIDSGKVGEAPKAEEEKPKKAPAKKTAKKAEDGEEKPKKATAKKTEDGEEKPKKAPAKKTTKKAAEAEEPAAEKIEE